MPKKLILSAICLAGLGLGWLGAAQAESEDAPLFAIDNSKWATYGNPAGGGAAAAKAADKGPAASSAASAPSGSHAVAVPVRPLNMPVMPGVNQSYLMTVKSTAEDLKPVSQAPSTPAEEQVFQIEDRNWQKADQLARRQTIADPPIENRTPDGSDPVPLDVRLSFLPNRDVAPLETVKEKANHRPKDLAMVEAIKKPKKQPANQVAECAAVDAYKKQQLEALQGDRRTLTELQKAIADLGLQKQLSFIAGGQAAGGLEAQSGQSNPAVVPKGQP